MITGMNVQVCKLGHKLNYIEPGNVVLSKIESFGGMWPCELYATTDCGKSVRAHYRSFVLSVHIQGSLVYRGFAESDDEEAEDYDGTHIDLAWLLYWTGIELTVELEARLKAEAKAFRQEIDEAERIEKILDSLPIWKAELKLKFR